MKKIFIIFTITILYSVNFAQENYPGYLYFGTSLDMITNPASIVMGESFVANPNNVSSFIENPANLSPSKHLGIYYNYRSHDWSEAAKNFNFTSVGISTHTGWGMLGFNMSQFSTGTNSINFYSDLISKEINRTYQLSLSKAVFKNLFVGASLKIFNHSKTGDRFSGGIESNNAYLIDLGFRYNISLGIATHFQNELNIGTAIQNFGTDYKEQNSFFSDNYYLVRLPKFFKIGFAYSFEFKNESGTSDFEGTITGQYKNLLNPFEDGKFDVDYWGAGLELLVKNIFCARVGFIQTPERWLFYERAKPILRYGFGLIVPFEKLGIKIPLLVSVDYSFIPINSNSSNQEGFSANNMLYAIGLSVRYKSVFF